MSRIAAALACISVLALFGCTADAAEQARVERITLDAPAASNPTVAVTERGAVLVAWVEGTSDSADVIMVRVGDGASDRVRVNDTAGDAAPHAQAPAQIIAADDGRVGVLWQNNTPVPGRRFPASDLRAAFSDDDGGTFGPTIYVNDDAGGEPASHTFHDLAAADGGFDASWIDGRVSGGDSASHVRYAHMPSSHHAFDAGAPVDREPCPCCRTSIARAADGTIYVAWRKIHDGSVRDIVVARSSDGGRTFAEPVRVHADDWVIDGCPHAGPALAVDEAGRVHVAWYTGADGRAGLHHAVSDDGARTFAAPHRLNAEGAVAVAQVAAVADRDGVWLAWEERGRAPHIRLAFVDARGDRHGVELPGAEGNLPSLAARDGRAALVWRSDAGVEVALVQVATER